MKYFDIKKITSSDRIYFPTNSHIKLIFLQVTHGNKSIKKQEFTQLNVTRDCKFSLFLYANTLQSSNNTNILLK